MRNKSHKTSYSSNQVHIVFIILMIIAISITFILSHIYTKYIETAQIDSLLIISQYRNSLNPEPKERFIFLILSAMLPCLALLIEYFTQRKKWTLSFVENSYVSNSIIFVFLTLFILPIFGLNIVFDGRPRLAEFRSIMAIGIIGIFSCILYFYFSNYSLKTKDEKKIINQFSKKLKFILFSVFIILTICEIVSWRLLSEASMTRSDAWFVHADAVIYSISQTNANRAIMSDFPSQYGLYSIYLKPIFLIIGTSILAITALFAFCQILSMSALYYVLQKIVRSRFVLLTFTFGLIAITFGTVNWLIGMKGDPYFQYWPIRFFWPAISIFLFFNITKNPTLLNSILFSVFSGIAFFWNIDSGVIVVFAFFAVLIFKWILTFFKASDSNKLNRALLKNKILIHTIVTMIAIFSTLIWLHYASNSAINWNWFLGHQRIFYQLGFGMIPLPTDLFPWMSIVGIYLLGLLISIHIWIGNPNSKFADLICYISLLGFGLFIYYQGRSHPFNLLSVFWPAATLMAIFSDRVIRAVHAGLLLRTHLLIPAISTSVLFIFSLITIYSVPRMLYDADYSYLIGKKYADPLIKDELTFIRKHTSPGDKCAILSLRQGLYHAATQTASPLTGPGYAELLLQSDLNQMVAELKSKKPKCVFLGRGSESALILDVDFRSVLSDYYIDATSDSDTMILLKPRE